MNKRLPQSTIALIALLLSVSPVFAQGGSGITAQAFGAKTYESQLALASFVAVKAAVGGCLWAWSVTT